MRAHMFGKLTRLTESLLTGAAYVRTLTCVNADMCSQIGTCCKRFRTKIALVGSFTLVAKYICVNHGIVKKQVFFYQYVSSGVFPGLELVYNPYYIQDI